MSFLDPERRISTSDRWSVRTIHTILWIFGARDAYQHVASAAVRKALKNSGKLQCPARKWSVWIFKLIFRVVTNIVIVCLLLAAAFFFVKNCVGFDWIPSEYKEWCKAFVRDWELESKLHTLLRFYIPAELRYAQNGLTIAQNTICSHWIPKAFHQWVGGAFSVFAKSAGSAHVEVRVNMCYPAVRFWESINLPEHLSANKWAESIDAEGNASTPQPEDGASENTGAQEDANTTFPSSEPQPQDSSLAEQVTNVLACGFGAVFGWTLYTWVTLG